MRSASNVYVVAVSGGVDSVVLLDALACKRRVAGINPWDGKNSGKIVVAHFDHGIRDDSAEDEAFVRELAEKYEFEYRSKRVELGAHASEERARTYRYAFLRDVCAEFNAQLVTAHHMDDIAETIAINATRGTGWRGLAVMDTHTIWRPFLAIFKQEILSHARQYGITWRKDSTNASSRYLRNTIRRKLHDKHVVQELAALRARQVELKHLIDNEVAVFASDAPYSRYFFAHAGDEVAIELLRSIFMQTKGKSLTIPARARALHAIKVARHASTAQVGEGVSLRFTRTHFIVE